MVLCSHLEEHLCEMFSQTQARRILAGHWLIPNGFFLLVGRIVFEPHLDFSLFLWLLLLSGPRDQPVGHYQIGPCG